MREWKLSNSFIFYICQILYSSNMIHIHILNCLIMKHKETVPPLNFPNADSVIPMKINANNFAEREHLDYVRSAKHAIIAYEKYHDCIRS
jgi:hypothetical protein